MMLTCNIPRQIIKPGAMMVASANRIEAFKVTASQKPSPLFCQSFIRDHGLDNQWERQRLNNLVINLQELLRAVNLSPRWSQLRQIVLSTNFLPENNPVGLSEERRSAFIDLAQDVEEIECAPVTISHCLTSPATAIDPFAFGSPADISQGIQRMVHFYEKQRRIDLRNTLLRGMVTFDSPIDIILRDFFNQAVVEGCTQLQILKSSCQLYPNLKLHRKNLVRVSKEPLAEVREKVRTRGRPKVINGENIWELEIISWFTIVNLAALAVIAKKLKDFNYYIYLKELICKETDKDNPENFVRELALQEFIELGLDLAGDFDSQAGFCRHFAKIPLLTSWQLEMAERGFRQIFNFFENFFIQYYEKLKA